MKNVKSMIAAEKKLEKTGPVKTAPEAKLEQQIRKATGKPYDTGKR